MTGNWNTDVDRDGLFALYADWLDLIPHLVGRFEVLWPDQEVRPHVDRDEIHVFWRYGRIGTIHQTRGMVCFSSSARRELKELDADISDLEFDESLRQLGGWARDERIRLEIDEELERFWRQALEDAQLYWNSSQAVEAKFDEIR